MQGSGYLDYRSERAAKARLYKLFQNKYLQKSISIISFVFLVFGVVLIFAMTQLSGLFLSIGLLFLSLRFWIAGDLSKLNNKVDSKSGKIDQMLDQSVLANLPKGAVSAYSVWKAMDKLPARYFFQNRFLLPSEIFEHMLPKDPQSESALWRTAESLRSKYGVGYYSQELVMTALILNVPDCESMLNRLSLTKQDIEDGMLWMKTLNEQSEAALMKKNFGGIARDWTHGWTPLLGRFGHSISMEIESYGFYQDASVHHQIVGSMIQSMSNSNTSIALVGDTGSGKTTTVYTFAEAILMSSAPKGLRYKQVVMLDASAMVSAATRPGQLEQLFIGLVNEASKAKNTILFFDNAELFFSDAVGAVDLTNVITQALDIGAVRMIFAVNPRQWQVLQTKNSALVGKIQSINIPVMTETDAVKVLQNQILVLEYKNKVVYTYQALKEAYKLGKRYEDSLAMPGAGLKVLESATTYADHGIVSDGVVKLSLEKSKGVKLQSADVQEASNLLNLEESLAQYVISQKRAIKVVSDALRRSRSGVGSSDRPVGTFLFLGPTGVGKTELTKALARTYFGDESAIVRADMNQFVGSGDVARLINSENLGDQLSFLGQIKKRPFSVVLLDEIEKAHNSVLGLLLQMLDEGVMKDSENRVVSFKDAIIIATSNAGANDIRSMVASGEINDPEAVKKIEEKLINDRVFTPEFVNRFDEVVLFEPLTPGDLVKVVDIIIGSINKTLEPKKIQVSVDEPGKKWLIDKGYDAMLGARPMRRMAQRYVENIVAKRVLAGQASPGSTINLSVNDFEIQDQ